MLSDFAEFSYKCDEVYHPEDEGGIAFDDPDIGVAWPIPQGVTPVLSDKDRHWEGLAAYRAARGL